MAVIHHVQEILDGLEALYGNEARPASDFWYEEPLDDLISVSYTHLTLPTN